MRPRLCGRGYEQRCSACVNIQVEYAHDGACMLESEDGEATLTNFKLKVVELAMENGNRNDRRKYTKLVYD